MAVRRLGVIASASCVTLMALMAIPVESPLQPLAFLAGGTWVADGELPGVGPFTAERTYRWTLGGKFIEQRHVMRFRSGSTETLGVIGWDAERKAVASWGFGDDGGIVTSLAGSLAGAEFRVEGLRVGGFVSGPIRSTNRKSSDDAFVEIAESKMGHDWVPLFAFTFTRKRGG